MRNEVRGRRHGRRATAAILASVLLAGCATATTQVQPAGPHAGSYYTSSGSATPVAAMPPPPVLEGTPVAGNHDAAANAYAYFGYGGFADYYGYHGYRAFYDELADDVAYDDGFEVPWSGFWFGIGPWSGWNGFGPWQGWNGPGFGMPWYPYVIPVWRDCRHDRCRHHGHHHPPSNPGYIGVVSVRPEVPMAPRPATVARFNYPVTDGSDYTTVYRNDRFERVPVHPVPHGAPPPQPVAEGWAPPMPVAPLPVAHPEGEPAPATFAPVARPQVHHDPADEPHPASRRGRRPDTQRP